MCASLGQWLEIEVEPLDSLFGIDPDHLPRPEEGFRERTAELRLAWAVATDPRPQLNLLRSRVRQAVAIRLARSAVAAGVVAGIGVGLAVQSYWPLPLVNARAEASESRSERGRNSRAGVRTEVAPTPTVQGERGTPPADPTVPTIVATPQRTLARVAPTVERVLPFDAQLTSILLSADRAVAIIDGEIVQVGGDVRGARVTEISEREVLLRDAAGRLRRLRMANGF